ncbi:putative MFS transporter [Daldinia loculata]|uniref:putative MFS transporter n=1 Tax=Daldinia loculata TaxID=103429 RepID=UPI0020C50466|nr:putative MFS transporter [Daldinia loculata]KAI1642341.1 putative MFS transporter [Daldinia loculata]
MTGPIEGQSHETDKEHGDHDIRDNAAYTVESLAHQLPNSTSNPHKTDDIPLEPSHESSDITEVDKNSAGGSHIAPEEDPSEPPYSVLSEPAKISIIITASFAAIISPISSSIYFPALNSLASDLHVSVSLITLTITTYMIFQGIAPSLIGNFSDISGRRPAYIICFSIYICANIGLALQNSYAALMVLRCLQSSGSSATIALGSAVVADVSTRAQRGKYIGYASMGVTLGPALGPIIGGLLDYYLGWRSIFWFLTIFASVFFAIVIVAMPETCRAVVGNGSVSPPVWQLSLWQYFRQRGKRGENPDADVQTMQRGRKRPNPLTSIKIAAQKEAGMILWYGALLYSGYFVVLSTLSTQLQQRYGFDSLKIGLCYLPFGAGSLTSRWTVGRILDKNFHRLARLRGLTIIKNRQQDIRKFPIEFARLQISIPLIYAACLAIIAYSWVMYYKTNLAGPLVMLFFTGHLVTGAFSSLNTLVVDINRETPATAVAANNLFRCLLGAGATAIANPLIDRIGIGWTGTLVAFLWILFSPLLWAVMIFGPKWRAEAHAKAKAKAERKKEKKAAADLEAGMRKELGPPQENGEKS